MKDIKMPAGRVFEFPDELKKVYSKAKLLEWITIIYVLTVVFAMYLVMGGSQAMKTTWIDDILSLIPPALLLISSRYFNKKPDKNHPYGYHRTSSIAFLAAGLTLTSAGLFLIYDALNVLLNKEYPTIQTIQFFGHDIWLGWLMIAVLLYSGVPTVFLGKIKKPLAEKLHDKILFTDADMANADWLTALAAFVGVIGIGFGIWWADSVAALIISADITHDGVANLKTAILDLMNRKPMTVDRKKESPKLKLLNDYLINKDWIKVFDYRLREEGHVYFGEVFIVIKEGVEDSINKLQAAKKEIQDIDWQFFDITVVPVTEIKKFDE